MLGKSGMVRVFRIILNILSSYDCVLCEADHSLESHGLGQRLTFVSPVTELTKGKVLKAHDLEFPT